MLLYHINVKTKVIAINASAMDPIKTIMKLSLLFGMMRSTSI